MIAEIKKCVYFFLPILVFLGAPLFVFIWSGEAIPLGEVIALQSGEKSALFGRAYSDVDQAYKIQTQSMRGADVVVIGSSRAMYIRREFFLPEVTFYNAGGVARNVNGFHEFLLNVPKEKYPKIILMGIDQRWFRSDYAPPKDAIDVHADHAWKEFFKYSWKKIYQDYVQNKFVFADLFKDQSNLRLIGLTALASGSGFRSDGSQYSRGFIDSPSKMKMLKSKVDSAITEVVGGRINFDYGNEINEKSVHAVESFLNECAKNNIIVIGYMSPHAPSLYKKIQEVNKLQSSVLTSTLEEVFARNGFVLYDLSDVSPYLGTDDEFIGDPWHGGDKLFAKVFAGLTLNNLTLKNIVDVTRLNDVIASSTDPHTVFPN